jgi:hypothetical protein
LVTTTCSSGFSFVNGNCGNYLRVKRKGKTIVLINTKYIDIKLIDINR